MPGQEDIDPQKAMAEAQQQKLELEIRKLEFDVESLGSTSFQLEKIMRFIPLITVIIAVAGFWFTIRQYNTQQAAAAKQQQQASDKLAADREQALLKPVWDKRLELYFAASEAAATIALSKDKAERDKAEAKFLQLYAGPLIIVEDTDVEGAMIKFRSCLTGQEACDEAELQRRSQALASRARDSIGKSYNIRLGDLKGKY